MLLPRNCNSTATSFSAISYFYYCYCCCKHCPTRGTCTPEGNSAGTWVECGQTEGFIMWLKKYTDLFWFRRNTYQKSMRGWTGQKGMKSGKWLGREVNFHENNFQFIESIVWNNIQFKNEHVWYIMGGVSEEVDSRGDIRQHTHTPKACSSSVILLCWASILTGTKL